MPHQIAAWLRDQLAARNESQRSFAARVGVAPNTVKDWLRGAQPTWENCHAIAEAFQADPIEVAELAGYPLPTIPSTRNAGRTTTGAADTDHTHGDIPLVTVEQLASAGPGAPLLVETTNGGRYVALHVAGNSMDPDVQEGDTLVIDLEQSQPDPGSIVVAVIDDQAYVKRLRRPGGGRPRLQSADGTLLPESPDQLYRVVQIRRDL